eukprot:5190287-Ditylum_brightwellii.AAC.1
MPAPKGGCPRAQGAFWWSWWVPGQRGFPCGSLPPSTRCFLVVLLGAGVVRLSLWKLAPEHKALFGGLVGCQGGKAFLVEACP